RFAYLLSVLEPQPDFALNLAADRFEAVPGKTTNISVAIERKNGFADAIDIVADSQPNGVSCKPITSKPRDASGNAVKLELSAGPNATSGPLRTIGKTTKEPTATRQAIAAIAGFEAKTSWPWVTVRAKSK